MGNKIKLTAIVLAMGMMTTLAVASARWQNSNTSRSQYGNQKSSQNGNSSSMSGNMQNNGMMMTGADKKFMMEAADGGMAEVALGQLATQNGASDEVKQFGQHMVDDHSKANDELKTLASQKGVMLPMEVSARHKKEMDRLSNLSGAAFDKAYMSLMVQDHVKDVAAFDRQAHHAKDADLRAWAAKTLPTLREHLQMARDINGKVSSARSARKGK